MTVKNGEQPTSIHDLKPKMELSGVVKKVELFGAFVDVGVGHDALLHISQLSSRHVRNVTDVVKEGDSIRAWVHTVDPEKNLISLTLIRPPKLSWDDIKRGDVFTGTVTRVERYGAFVDIGAERPGRVHVSELATDYVRNPEDVVKVGDEVRVKVLDVNPRKRQIDFSMKALEESAPREMPVEEEDSRMPTAMELAFRRAMEGTELEEEFAPRRSRRKRGNRRQVQEEILARTLQQRNKG